MTRHDKTTDDVIQSLSGAYFISGIHTDAGKSYCTGWLARQILDNGKTVVTQKFIQTGNVGVSEDIELHRRLMGIGLLPDDIDGTTAPIIYSHPCSPQLAARIDARDIDLKLVDSCSETLLQRYNVLLLEGAGGLMVPISDNFLTVDYITSRKLPLIFVVNGSLGSINHAILSFEAIKNRGIEMPIVLYNRYFDSDPWIADDTHEFIARYLNSYFPECTLIDVPTLSN